MISMFVKMWSSNMRVVTVKISKNNREKNSGVNTGKM